MFETRLSLFFIACVGLICFECVGRNESMSACSALQEGRECAKDSVCFTYQQMGGQPYVRKGCTFKEICYDHQKDCKNDVNKCSVSEIFAKNSNDILQNCFETKHQKFVT